MIGPSPGKRGQKFARYESEVSPSLLNWAYVFRESLTSAAESIEADATDDNQLASLRRR